MSAEAARNEAVKNSMFPGTALMYWLGTTTLRDLRTHASAAQGEAVSLRRLPAELRASGPSPGALIRGRLVRLANRVGREQVMAAADCGFSSQACYHTEVHPTVMWAKFRSMAEGARLASERLWR